MPASITDGTFGWHPRLAEKRKITKYRAGQLALDRNMREMWATGIHKFSQLCICRGRIRMVAHKDTGHVYTELWGTGVYMHLRWFADLIPPTIRNGHMATIIGNIQTYNLNSHVGMSNCLHVPKYGPQLGREVRELMSRFVLQPKTYVPEDQLDVIRDRIRENAIKRIKASKDLRYN